MWIKKQLNKQVKINTCKDLNNLPEKIHWRKSFKTFYFFLNIKANRFSELTVTQIHGITYIYTYSSM